MSYLARARAVHVEPEDTRIAAPRDDLLSSEVMDPIEVLTMVDAVWPDARLTARRTPQEFREYWSDLSRLAESRKRAAIQSAATLGQIRSRHGVQ
jgi:hypothetical protein